MKKVTITKSNLADIKEIYIHDAEVDNVVCSYKSRQVNISLKLDGTMVLLEFYDVVYSEISYIEPWGSGFYIFEIDAEENTLNDIFNMEEEKYENFGNLILFSILLNSGDKIKIVAEKLIVSGIE